MQKRTRGVVQYIVPFWNCSVDGRHRIFVFTSHIRLLWPLLQMQHLPDRRWRWAYRGGPQAEAVQSNPPVWRLLLHSVVDKGSQTRLTTQTWLARRGTRLVYILYPDDFVLPPANQASKDTQLIIVDTSLILANARPASSELTSIQSWDDQSPAKATF